MTDISNEQILNTNKLIRQNIFNNSEKILVEGDIVTGYTTLTDEEIRIIVTVIKN